MHLLPYNRTAALYDEDKAAVLLLCVLIRRDVLKRHRKIIGSPASPESRLVSRMYAGRSQE